MMGEANNSSSTAEEDEAAGETVRIFVGGLGATVKADDLRSTLGSLGRLDSVEIVRTKGRSFAYLDLVPSSLKSVSKLFNTYNGCMWKGGKLKLEKAKEHYLLRLEREWKEDAELANRTTNDAVDATKSVDSPENLNKVMTPKMAEVRIFFPKLRKLRPLPLNGTGKHKYSFQRVEVPALPTHFCDCEEHSVPFLNDSGAHDGGVDEKELNIMESVMNKILERKTNLKAATIQPELVNKREDATEQVEEMTVDGSEADDITDGDEDNLVMNMVSGKKVGKAPVDGWTRERTLDNRGKAADGLEFSMGKLSDNMLKSRRSKIIHAGKKGEPPHLEAVHGKVASINIKGDSSSKKIRGKRVADVAFDDYEANDTMDDDDDDDDDNLVMNMVAGSKVRKLAADGWIQEIVSGNEDTAGGDLQISKYNLFDTSLKSQSKTISSNMKRKSPNSEATDGRVKSIDVEGNSSSKKASLQGSALARQTKSASQLSNIDIRLPSSHTTKEISNSEEHQKEKQNAIPIDFESPSSSAEEPREIINLPDKPNPDLEKGPKKGALWAQKSSWTELVGGTSTSFSISQILPEMTFEKDDPPKSLFAANSTVNEQSKTVAKSTCGLSSGDVGSKASSGVLKKKTFITPSTYSIGETCSFMRSETSMKEWKNTKAALSGSLKIQGKK